MLGPAVSGAVTPGRVVRRSRHGPNQNRASQNPQWYGFRRDTRRRGRSHHNVRDRRLVPNRWQSGQRICNGSPRRSGNGMCQGYAAPCECSSTTVRGDRKCLRASPAARPRGTSTGCQQMGLQVRGVTGARMGRCWRDGSGVLETKNDRARRIPISPAIKAVLEPVLQDAIAVGVHELENARGLHGELCRPYLRAGAEAGRDHDRGRSLPTDLGEEARRTHRRSGWAESGQNGKRRRKKDWWTARGSNSRPPHCERGALPTELAAHCF